MGTCYQVMKKVYPFRQWPLYTGYEKLKEQFGYDAMAYFTSLFQFCAFYLILLFACLPLSVSYTLADQQIAQDPFEYNAEPLVGSVATSPLRGVVWTCALVLSVLFARFIGYQRKYFVAEFKRKAKVQDVSAVVMNIPGAVSDAVLLRYLNDLRVKDKNFDSFGEGVVGIGGFEASETQPGPSGIFDESSESESGSPHVHVERYLRVVKPRSLKLRRKLYDLQKKYNDYYAEFGDQPPKSGCFGGLL